MMRLSNQFSCRICRATFAFFMAWIWAGGVDRTFGQPAPTTRPAEPTAEQRAWNAEQFRRSLRALDDASRQMPRDSFELRAVVERVGNDPAKLFEWVRDQTVWVPYRGALRAETGVLMDRLGNSLDRSLLLAGLLKAAGHEVRLARAELTVDQAMQVLPRVRTAPQLLTMVAPTTAPAPAPTTVPVQDSFSAALEKYQIDEKRCREVLDRLALRQQLMKETMAQRLATQAPRLAELLLPTDDPKVKAAYDAAVKSAQDALRDHWWVQRNDGGNWIDLDPLPGDAKPGEHVAAAANQTLDAKDLPADLRHEVEVRVVVERWEAGAVKEATVLRKVLRPSEMLGKRVTVNCIPMDWPADFQITGQDDLPGRIAKGAVQQQEWVPVLAVDDETTIQSSVTDSGDVIDKPALDPSKRVGKGGKSKYEQAVGLMGVGDPAAAQKPVSHLTAQWLEYEIRVPGLAPQVVRREIFDLFGPAARASEGGLRQLNLTDAAKMERALGMISQTELLVLPCRLSEAFVFERYAKGMIANGPALSALINDPPENGKALEPMLKQLRPMLSELYGVAMLRQESPVAAYAFVDQPVILTMRHFFRPRGGDSVNSYKAFDIVSNATGVHRWSPLAPSAVRLIQGVVDTNAEALALTDIRREANAADALAAADERGEAWSTLKTVDDARQLKLPDDAQARIRQDLSAGQVVLGPAAAVDKSNSVAWWRVDPVTGQTLGMGDRGWGSSMVETAMLIWFAVFAVTITGCLIASIAMSPTGAVSGNNILMCLGIAVLVATIAAGFFLAGAYAAGGGAVGGGAAGAGAGGGGAAAGGAVGGGGGGAVAGGAAGGGAVGGGAVGGGAVGGGAVGGGAVGGGAVGGGAVGGGAVGGGAGGLAAGGGASPLASSIGGAVGGGAGPVVIGSGSGASGLAGTVAASGAGGGAIGGGGAVASGGAGAAGAGGAIGAAGGGTLSGLGFPP